MIDKSLLARSPRLVAASQRSPVDGGMGYTLRGRVTAIGFVLAALLPVLYVHQGLSGNPTSRLLTVWGVVERGHLWADEWGHLTIDKSLVRGHIYSDKAPLSSFLVLPFYAGYRAIHRGAQGAVERDASVHLADLVAAGVPFALFALALRWRLRARCSASEADWWALAAAFSTCLFNYGNMFWGHMLAGALLIGCYLLVVELERGWLLAGAAGGAAVATEYPLALPIGILYVWAVACGPPRERLGRAFWMAAGGAPFAVALLVYNRAVTGHPLDFPYSHVVDAQFAFMHTAFGIRLPSLSGAWELVFGQYRGLLFYCPTLAVLAPLAFLDGAPRRRALLAILCVAQLAFASSYLKWDGGWCTGPRYLTPAIVLLVYEGVGALPHAPRWVRVTFGLLAVWGAAINLLAAVTDPIPPERFAHPLFELFLPRLRAGAINRHMLPVELGVPNGWWVVAAWPLLFVAVAAAIARLDDVLCGRSSPPST